MNSEPPAVAGTVAERHRSSPPPAQGAAEMLIGGGCYRRSCGASETVGAMFCWAERPEKRRPAPEKTVCPATCRRSWRAWKPLLVGGEAEEEGGRAEGGRKYLLPRLERAPDVGRPCRSRRARPGYCGRRLLLLGVWFCSARRSGAC